MFIRVCLQYAYYGKVCCLFDQVCCLCVMGESVAHLIRVAACVLLESGLLI